jgi:hypothetical protein
MRDACDGLFGEVKNPIPRLWQGSPTLRGLFHPHYGHRIRALLRDGFSNIKSG